MTIEMVKAAFEKDLVSFEKTFKEQIEERIKDRIEALREEYAQELFGEAKDCDDEEEEEDDDEDMKESENEFKRGDIVTITNKNKIFYAVMLSPNSAVYIDDDIAERVPENALKHAVKAKKVSSTFKKNAQEYLKNMK